MGVVSIGETIACMLHAHVDPKSTLYVNPNTGKTDVQSHVIFRNDIFGHVLSLAQMALDEMDRNQYNTIGNSTLVLYERWQMLALASGNIEQSAPVSKYLMNLTPMEREIAINSPSEPAQRAIISRENQIKNLRSMARYATDAERREYEKQIEKLTLENKIDAL